jgi:SNF2 family DNA or RNA helicase
LFLISLKAGGVGLNLPQADTVIHYDPWWNPAVENQATDRAHRIGQTQSVWVVKLVAQGTIEERILALQERKAALADSMYSGAAARKQPLFTESDLAELLRPLSAG